MKLIERITEAETTRKEIIIMPLWNYKLPLYAEMYIRPAYESIFNMNGLLEFVQHFMVEYSETNNEAKKRCIETIVFPLYRSITGQNFDTNIFNAII